MRSSSSPIPHRLAPLLALALVALALLWPAAASACPVCFVAREASRLAFMWTALLMTFLPLAMLGGIVYWLWRTSQRDSRGE
jgi:hypothetical protein